MKKILLLLISCVSLLGCGPARSEPDVNAIVASTLQAMTAAAPSNGLPVVFNNISFAIPLELNASATQSTVTDVEYPYINASGGPMPEHVVFEFTNYPLDGDSKIMVFKSSEYAAYGPPLQDTVTALLAGTELVFCKDYVKPWAGHFYVQVKPVSFQNGHGTRCLTEVLQGIGPIANSELFYYFEGITDDGMYFVSAEFHVNASFLVADGQKDALTPPDGIPFNWAPDLDYAKYMDEVSQKLNDTPAENFTPSLVLLDRIIQSMRITNP